MKIKEYIYIILLILSVLHISSCSTLKYVDKDEYLLNKNNIVSDNNDIKTEEYIAFVKQKPNVKWFSIIKIPLKIYSLSGRDSTKWINRTLKSMGEPPQIYDTLSTIYSCNNISQELFNRGYLKAKTVASITKNKRKAEVTYKITTNELYSINNIRYNIIDTTLIRILNKHEKYWKTIKIGDNFSVYDLDNQRKQISTLLQNNGYYKFNKDFIQFDVDTIGLKNKVNLLVSIYPYQLNSDTSFISHSQYFINNVYYKTISGKKLPIRKSIIDDAINIEKNSLYRVNAIQRAYSGLGRLSAISYSDIELTQLPNKNLLDCIVKINPALPNTISFQPEGTNTSGNLGVAATLTYQNRNIFKGSELLSIQFRGAFEAISKLEGYKKDNYTEYGVESKLMFPRFLAPFLSKSFRRGVRATTELSIGYNNQNRPEFHRRLFSSSIVYKWSEPNHHTSYVLNLINLNYIYMPWISETFKQNYLDNTDSRSSILKYNYQDIFIMNTGFSINYNNNINALKASVELGGNILRGIASMAKLKRNNDDKYTLFNIAFAQYVKADATYTAIIKHTNTNSLVFHSAIGIAYPYGNSNILPFEKRYFSGGANSVRGWGVRELGPGKFKRTDGNIDFINQTGDIKLDLSMEYRSFLFWKINGALFIDAGNIWTIRKYKDQDGGEFNFSTFYKQIAVSYGLGFRLNFDYFIIRFDAAMKAINPVYNNKQEHYPIINHNFSRDFTFHFAIGMPF